MEKVSIRELRGRAGEVAESVVIHAQLEIVQEKSSRNGNPYLELKFVDAEDSLILRAWNDTPAFRESAGLKSGQFFEIRGDFYHNADFNSLDARNWSLNALVEEAIDALLAGSATLRKRQETDFLDILAFVDTIADPRLKALCLSFLDRFGQRFRRTGAARDYHHARRGGLVEHVTQMMRTASAICEAYPSLNRDLLLAGVLFHDCGKLWENVFPEKGFNMPYSETGELIGHIPMGMEVVNKLWRDLLEGSDDAEAWKSLTPASEEVRLHLLHLIGSHHGEMAFGSPVLPKTPEAIVLHHVDNIDAKMEMFARGYQVAAPLGKNIFERVRPLPARLVRPLEHFVPEGAATEIEGDEPLFRVKEEEPAGGESDVADGFGWISDDDAEEAEPMPDEAESLEEAESEAEGEEAETRGGGEPF